MGHEISAHLRGIPTAHAATAASPRTPGATRAEPAPTRLRRDLLPVEEQRHHLAITNVLDAVAAAAGARLLSARTVPHSASIPCARASYTWSGSQFDAR